MVEPAPKRLQWKRQAFGWFAALVICGCQTKPKPETGSGTETDAAEGAKVEKPEEAPAPASKEDVGLAFLMTMTWEEARAISGQSLEMPPFFRVAADAIDVLKTGSDGRPVRVRARGKVYIEMEFSESGRVLCQEAYISDDELILRGKPLMQRGGSVVEGIEDFTVFYMLGPRLRVIGRHRFNKESEMIAEVRKAEAVAEPVVGRGGGFAELPGLPPALPMMRGPWGGGPNPLLPPLSPNVVPQDVRLELKAEAEAVDVIPLELPNEKPVKIEAPAVEIGIEGPPVLPVQSPPAKPGEKTAGSKPEVKAAG
jgi:hypothetical protein